MKILITGVAGFIGYHISKRLLKIDNQVIGIDNINNYYDVTLKQARLNKLQLFDNFKFYKIDLRDKDSINILFSENNFERVIHLGAQVGVQYSLDNPYVYADSNLIGHLNILEGCRRYQVAHLLYASSSSVYGLNNKLPFSSNNSVDHPISLYAVTKKTNELMAHTYSYLYQLPTTGLRFFTVYGPWGRPDMSLFKFTDAILNGKYINVYNYGEIWRDFTFIDDVIEVIVRLLDIIPFQNNNWTVETGVLSSSSAPYRIYNIGTSNPVKLIHCIEILENFLGIKSKKNLLPMHLGDLLKTSADTKELYDLIGFKPNTPIVEGIKLFVNWYRKHYNF